MILLTAVSVNLNNRKGILATCRSIRELKKMSWFEHVIVDGGSTDGSITQLEGQDLERTRFIVGRDRGIYDAMNKGIVAARGLFVWMLNSGDEFAGEVRDLAWHLAAMQRHNIGLALFGAYLRREEGLADKRHRAEPRKLSYMMSAIHQSILVRRDVHRRFGLYTLKYKLASDYDLVSFLSRKRSVRVSVSEVPLSIFCMGGLTDQRFWRSRLESVHATARARFLVSIFGLALYASVYLKRKVREWCVRQ